MTKPFPCCQCGSVMCTHCTDEVDLEIGWELILCTVLENADSDLTLLSSNTFPNTLEDDLNALGVISFEFTSVTGDSPYKEGIAIYDLTGLAYSYTDSLAQLWEFDTFYLEIIARDYCDGKIAVWVQVRCDIYLDSVLQEAEALILSAPEPTEPGTTNCLGTYTSYFDDMDPYYPSSSGSAILKKAGDTSPTCPES